MRHLLERIVSPTFKDRLYPLVCAHCGVNFDARWGIYKHVKYDGTKPYCSEICKRACMPKPPMNGSPRTVFTGPCEHCGSSYESKTNKLFCSLACYTQSARFKEVQELGLRDALKANCGNPNGAGREDRECPHCGEKFNVITSARKKFCGRLCMRKWLSGRFDRWVASPKSIALPQNYDEFLSAGDLPCLVEGCGWVGNHLSIHMNTTHGIPASEFKRAAGFNLTSGIISADLQERLSARTKQGVAVNRVESKKRGSPNGYASLEGREHQAKARAIGSAVGGPERTCCGCGASFQQSTPYGRAKYCSVQCRNRNAAYAGRRANA